MTLIHNLDVIFSNNQNILGEIGFCNPAPLQIFHEEVIDFLGDLSRSLMSRQDVKAYPDLITFAFFCRRANILAISRTYSSKSMLRVGRGAIFHIAPSNVPLNFAYSAIAGLLSGNSNIVRLPTKQFPQIDLLLDEIQSLFSDTRYKFLDHYLTFVRYDKKNKDLTKILSLASAIRIIWGGDNTVNEVRRLDANPKTFDITFPDRYSLCIFKASEILEGSLDQVVSKFYIDTFLFDQNACTSPHLILWDGDENEVERAKSIFWGRLDEYVVQNYSGSEIASTDKFVKACELSVRGIKCEFNRSPSGLLWRGKLESLDPIITELRSYGGYFYEFHSRDLASSLKFVNEKFQTMAYFGFEKSELFNIFSSGFLAGIDRIVPIGRTAEFSLTWDGYDLIACLSRCIDVQ